MTKGVRALLIGIGVITVIAMGSFILYLLIPSKQLMGTNSYSQEIYNNASDDIKKYVGLEIGGIDVKLAIKNYKDSYAINVKRGTTTKTYDAATPVPTSGDPNYPKPTELYRASLQYDSNDTITGITFTRID